MHSYSQGAVNPGGTGRRPQGCATRYKVITSKLDYIGFCRDPTSTWPDLWDILYGSFRLLSGRFVRAEVTHSIIERCDRDMNGRVV